MYVCRSMYDLANSETQVDVYCLETVQVFTSDSKHALVANIDRVLDAEHSSPYYKTWSKVSFGLKPMLSLSFP
jgi:hypothetical protein